MARKRGLLMLLLVAIVAALPWLPYLTTPSCPSFLGPSRRPEATGAAAVSAALPAAGLSWISLPAWANNFDPATMPTRYSAFDPANAKDNEAILNFVLVSAFLGLFAAQVADAYKEDK